MASSDASYDKTISLSLPMAKSSLFHKESLIANEFPTPAACSSHTDSSGWIKRFYVIYDRRNYEDPCSFTCIVLNKGTGETTTLTVSPDSETAKKVVRPAVLSQYTPVALGSNIYIIGGFCHYGLCPNGNPNSCEEHVNVRVFSTLRPEDGWKEVAPMHAPRVKPAAVVMDGKIYVFGGVSPKEFDFGEYFDPDTNMWHHAPGCPSFFAHIQDTYVDPMGAKSIIIHSNATDKLFAFRLDTQRWEIFGNGFANCHRPGAILDGVIYAILEDENDYTKGELQGYDMIQKRWFPVQLMEPDSKIEFCTYTVFVIATGSDMLCLLWHRSYKIPTGGYNKRIECVELRLDKIYCDTGSIVNLTATKVSNSYFPVKSVGCLESILTL